MTDRKIIQVTCNGDDDETVYALCDDGTLWLTYPRYQQGWKEWEQMPAIPQSEADQ